MTKNEKKQNINSNSIFWVKGEGMSRRYHNIGIVKQLIRSGLSYQQIVRIARRYFTIKLINQYYDIALDEIKNPIEEIFDSNEESFMEQVKKGKIKPRKDVPDS